MPEIPTAVRYLSDEEVKELVNGLVQNKYFLSDQIPPTQFSSLLGTIFIPLSMMKEEDLKVLIADDVVHFYEEYSKALPRGVNGFPMFTSFRALTRGDYRAIYDLEGKLREAMKAVLEAPNKEQNG